MAFHIARRDLRGALKARWRTFLLLVSGVLIGVAAIAFVGASTQMLRDGASQGALEAVGGDLSFRLFHRAPSAEEFDAISALGETSLTAELRPMVRVVNRSALVELKGVDGAYPLYGDLKTIPQAPHAQLLEDNGALADQALFEDLQLDVGDWISIGQARFQLRAKLVGEPDRAFRAFTLGPRVMVDINALAQTGLVEPGAEVYFYTRVKLPQGTDAGGLQSQIESQFPNSGWRMVNAQQGVPGLSRVLSIVHVLLLFIGLGVMLVGGAGVGGAVKAHLDAKMDTIAILKSIGTPPNVITLALGLELGAGAGLGALIGVGVGALGPSFVTAAFADQLPFVLASTPPLAPLLSAFLFGLLVALLFAWWPLMHARSVSTRELLRERFTTPSWKLSKGGWLGAGVLAGLIVAVLFWVSPMPLLSVVFLLAGLVLALIYWALGKALGKLAKVFKSRGRTGQTGRLALGNLSRAGAPTGPVVMALGLCLTLLVALDGVEGAAERHVQATLPSASPDLVLFSLPKWQSLDISDDMLAWEGLDKIDVGPFLHARVQSIKGQPVRSLNIPAGYKWVVRGDRGVSFDDSLFSAKGPAFIVDQGFADAVGLRVGDKLTLNVSGHLAQGQVVELETMDWTQLQLDFPIIGNDKAFEGIPHVYAMSLTAKAGYAEALKARIRDNYPDAPTIEVAGVLSAIATVVDVIIEGLRVASVVTGVAALIVLAGSVLQGLGERMNDAMLFKVLGARQGQLMGQLVVEFSVLGVMVALVATPLGLAMAGGVAKAAKLSGWQVSLSSALELAAMAISVTVAVGLAATWGAYGAAPARFLRNRGL
ncbi:FtsX-like permease family protein [Magnetovibrio sp. PR-2]|uniref:ABC transporter permease n=1 Tax=Magnetovibrio sp. PR-2 TaxID=3120356 RepID=UPI002FCE185C